MTELNRFYRIVLGQSLAISLGLFLAASVGCAHRGAAQQAPAQTAPVASQKSEGGDAHATQAQAETKISPQEAEELFRSVDEILKFASTDTGLPIKQVVKRKLIGRDEVAAYVEKHLSEDEDAQRLRRSELVLKKFGLLPRDFDLGKFLVTLLREQVAGYYDPKTKTVNLLDWLDIEQQRPVLAHELTHSLQDQSFDIEKWMKAGEADLASKNQPTPADIDSDEISAARQAVVEGQAMVVLIDYMLAPMGKSMAESPEVAEALKQGMLVGTADQVQFRNAPIYMKEALTFPYRYGIDFEAELLKHGGKQKAFADVFANPPRSTRQIMEPQTYLSGEHIGPMLLPGFEQAFRNYDRFDIGAIGEFDVSVLIDQYAGPEASRELYPHWRGGYYYAARAKSDPTSALALLYVSRWSGPERAAQFAAIYAKSLPKRYQHARAATDGKPVADATTLETLTGEHTWLTEDGPVVIKVQDDTVMVTESLDRPATERVEQELFTKETEK